MRSRVLAAVVAVIATTSIAFADADTMAGIKAACTADWPGDYSMQEFCINNQVESYNHLVQINNGNQNDDEKAMLGKCLGDWKTATGSDWSMVEFCYKDQHEAYERLNGK
ncbi:MAG: hypothetical protein E5Y34_30920 [Mesorhizobium sp.]|uniref:hypothetical protein n=1 Tax=Mesorhizobium sp. TaxID=1871066 RepID=UPI0011F98EAC|nr:hypothetical protein [Mesorhizobium sp.]TIM94398.1 MAG: hypothetical protein E5Y34_30920 [Mesorhizobium sp.]